MKTKTKAIQINENFWSLTPEDVLKKLSVQPTGLTTAEADKRRKIFGDNLLEKDKRFAKTKIFFKQFISPLIFILIIAGIVTLVIQEWVDAAVIFLAIGVNAALGFYQENKAEHALERLRSYIKQRVRVIRDGVEQEIDSEQILPGDIMHISYGNRVPADARLITVQDFSVDEAILTGESLPITKSIETLNEKASLPERKNMIFGGTLVVGGYATAVITNIGRSTEIGKIAEMVATTESDKTPLQKAVWKLAWVIAGVAIVLIAGIFALGVYRSQPIMEMFLISAAVAVGAIPEALPIALTVVLAVGVERLAKRKGIMRNLSAAETLGSTSVILTDKTGTLTKADMRLVDVVTTKDLLNNKWGDNAELDKITSEEQEILRLAVVNTDVLVENPKDKPRSWKLSGKPIETHIFRSAAIHGVNWHQLKNQTRHHPVLPFNSVNKFSVSFVEQSKDLYCSAIKDKNFYIILGAPDILLERSKMNKADYAKAKSTIAKMSSQGKRLLGVAVLSQNKKTDPESMTPKEVKGLTLVGIMAFFDPIRPGVSMAIKNMNKSGVRVIMATGDLKGTALSVATDLGWEVKDDQVVTGEELQKMSDKELLAKIDDIKVYARVTPEDKMRVGLLLKQKGEVVGMTGDGVNDAPSLKAVDIGIAVGSGSDVAKGVADLVLLNDNFETIVAAIEEGRRILNNIRKSFVYLMSNSLDEVILIGGSLLLGLSLPLTALQIIWVNFFTGSLPAISFAFDDFIDKDKTNSKSSRHIIDGEVKTLTLGIGILTSVLLLILYWVLTQLPIPQQEAKTFLFVCFSTYILFVSFAFRSLKKPIFSYNIFSNKLLTLSVLAGMILIAITIYIPFLQQVFGTTALGPKWFIWVVLWLILNISMVEYIKWLYRNK